MLFMLLCVSKRFNSSWTIGKNFYRQSISIKIELSFEEKAEPLSF